MPETPNGWSLNDLIAQASAKGHRVRRAQVIRWHKAGLVPRPRRQWRGQGQGSVSLGYPPEALHHVLAVSTLLRLPRHRNLKRVAWIMWLAGYPVTPAIRGQLQAIADAFEREMRAALTSMESDTAGVSARELFQELQIAKALRTFGLRPSRFRGHRAGEFETALALIVRLLSGQGLNVEDITDEQLAALEHGLLGMRVHSPALEQFIREQQQVDRAKAPERWTPEARREAKARAAKVASWRPALRTQLSGLSFEIGASMLSSALPFEDDDQLERWREESIAMWLLVNGMAMGPPPPVLLMWYWFRGNTMLGAWSSPLPPLTGERGYDVERLLVAVYRLSLERWGLPLPQRKDLQATLLPKTLEEDPDAHLICRPIKTGTRRARRQRVRSSARR